MTLDLPPLAYGFLPSCFFSFFLRQRDLRQFYSVRQVDLDRTYYVAQVSLELAAIPLSRSSWITSMTYYA